MAGEISGKRGGRVCVCGGGGGDGCGKGGHAVHFVNR